MTGIDLEQDKNTTNRTSWLGRAFATSFLGGMTVAIGFTIADKVADYFMTKMEDYAFILYFTSVFFSVFLVGQLVSRLLRPFGFRGFGKQSGVNMTPIKFFAGAILGIFVTLFLGALIFMLVNK